MLFLQLRLFAEPIFGAQRSETPPCCLGACWSGIKLCNERSSVVERGASSALDDGVDFEEIAGRGKGANRNAPIDFLSEILLQA